MSLHPYSTKKQPPVNPSRSLAPHHTQPRHPRTHPRRHPRTHPPPPLNPPPTWPSRQRPVALATASDPAIRLWRLRRDGSTLPPCVTRPPPAPACRTQPAGSPRGAPIARKAVRRIPKTVPVGQDESYLRWTVSKLIRSPKKNNLEVERIAGVPLVLRGYPREGRPLHNRHSPTSTPIVIPAKAGIQGGRGVAGLPPLRPAPPPPLNPPPTWPSRQRHVALATRRAATRVKPRRRCQGGLPPKNNQRAKPCRSYRESPPSKQSTLCVPSRFRSRKKRDRLSTEL